MLRGQIAPKPKQKSNRELKTDIPPWEPGDAKSGDRDIGTERL